MREILFRGKRLDNGEWAEGDLIQAPDGRAAISTEEDLLGVDPETVCQYTGLIDKNGRKVFEGDIIRFEKKTYTVVWLEEIASFDSKPLKGERCRPSMNKGTMKVSEVIGNIFDNPELLKGGDTD